MDYDINDKEFDLFKQLIYSESGINLSPAKRELLKSRLSKRLRVLSLNSFKDYYKYVTEADTTGREIIHMIDCISTNLTDFFREITHFQFLKKRLLPSLLEKKQKNRERKIRIWSAGCSTGEEPYTISMVLSESIEQLSNWDIKILATDLSTRVLEKAKQGLYQKERLKNIDTQMISTYFKKAENGHYQVKDSLKNMIVFRRFNLMDNFPFKGQFDFIFCRNVMIYFNKQTQNELITKFYKYLTPEGYLFIGHSESLAGINSKFKYVVPTVYKK